MPEMFPQARLVDLLLPIFEKMGVQMPRPDTSNAFKIAVDGGRLTVCLWGGHDGLLSIIAMPSTHVDPSDPLRLGPLLASNALCLDPAPLITTVDEQGCLMIWARLSMEGLDSAGALALFDRVVDAGLVVETWLSEPLPPPPPASQDHLGFVRA